MIRVERAWVAERLVLPAAEEFRRGWYAEQVVAAHETIVAFAADHGWESRVRPFFQRVEVFADQGTLWARLRSVFGLPDDAPRPTPGLAARIPLPELVAWAGDARFEDGLADRIARPAPPGGCVSGRA